MGETVVFPDAERVVIDHLNSVLEAPVSLTVPHPRPDSFVTVQRAGGPRLNLVADNARLLFECWGPSPTPASTLAAHARAEVLAMRGTVVGGVTVYRIEEVGGPGFLPDPHSNQARYTFSATVAMRGV